MNSRRICLTHLRHRQLGLGLIEIMVALAISAVLLTGIIQIFLSSKLSYRVAEASARVQESGRFAVNLMTEDLRMAGYMGDYRSDPGTPLAGHDGSDMGWSPDLPAQLAGQVRPGTDVVITIAHVQMSAYYIGTNAQGEPALFRMSLINNGGLQAQEIIEGAEDLQVLYGEDTDGDGIANRYARAHEVNMDNVVSVRYSLLLRSEDYITSEPQVYMYNGEEHTADDHRLRRVFGSTVKLRNRGLL